jgi:ribosome silencing factor RsfS/YbeB/iojap
MPTKKKPTTIAKKPAAKKAAPAKKKAAPAKKATPAKKAAKKVATKAAKKPTAKKVATKAAKKPTAKKAAKKVATKAAKKTTAKKAAKKVAIKTTAKKAAKKVAKKVAKKTTAKKVAKKTTAKKAAKKATAKKVAKKTTAKKATDKKATAKKPTAKKATAPRIDLATSVPKAPSHGAVALPGRKNGVPKSYEAASTLIPNDDALEGAMGDAFDAVFASPYGAQQKPKKPKSTEPFVPGDPTADLAQICAALALDKKADDVVILEVADLTSYADFFVIAGASSERLAQAVARTISDELRKRGRQPLSTDGMEQGNWVILDYGAVVVHVFMATARAYYDLDGFWSDAPRVEVDEDRGQGALKALGG